MAKPTFNINELVGQVGRAPAYPFQFPSLAQQMLSSRPTPPAPVTASTPMPQNQPPPPPAQPTGLRAALIGKIPIPVPPQRQV